MRLLIAIGFACTCAALASMASARETGDPIRLTWLEGDVAGFTPIFPPGGSSKDGAPIGFVEYHQHRRGDVLETTRVARFADGSSDEDEASARVADGLRAIRGRQIVRDARGRVLVDLIIDVAGQRLTGF